MNVSELFDLSGKVAVITGGAGSIGLAYGRALGEAGASVVLADVDEGAATKAADAVKADGFAAVGVAVDVRDVASAQAMLACRLFEERFSTERWARLAKRGARPQRLVWAEGTDLETNGNRRYLDALSVSNTVHALSDSTLVNVNTTGLGAPSPAIDVHDAADVVSDLAALSIDLDEVAAMLEKQGLALAHVSLSHALDRLSTGSEQR